MKKKSQVDQQFDQAEKYVMQAIESLDFAMSLVNQTQSLDPSVATTLQQLHQQLSDVYNQSFHPVRYNQKPPMSASRKAQRDDVLYLPESFGKNIEEGARVEISEGSGIDSGKTGIVVSRREVKTDGRGIPTNLEGHYKPVDWKKEVAVKLDDGSLITMFKDRLRKVSCKLKFADIEDIIDEYGEGLDENVIAEALIEADIMEMPKKAQFEEERVTSPYPFGGSNLNEQWKMAVQEALPAIERYHEELEKKKEMGGESLFEENPEVSSQKERCRKAQDEMFEKLNKVWDIEHKLEMSVGQPHSE